MLRVTLIVCGKLKEKYLKEATAEYEKRLSSYVSLKTVELDDGPDMAAEAARILKSISDDMYVITLEIEGTEMGSVDLADRIQELMTDGKSSICFIIGGSDGLDKSVTDISDMHLSFSRLTFPHQLMRIIFLEQLYRAFRIIRGEPYHK
ncbi:MAG: 23S rRNA (pseudouridine(1915)-N(3))-methyltransferase RlmH [Lachnospiraceae bacterium]|nr:23S rRNA (pseudouridine(1915)-N(3))-methyltransferase RlmH [Lachnospiraceae bacterium]